MTSLEQSVLKLLKDYSDGVVDINHAVLQLAVWGYDSPERIEELLEKANVELVDRTLH